MAAHDYKIVSEGEKRILVIDCQGCEYGASAADFPFCMQEILDYVSKTDPDMIVLADVYEKMYDEKQTEMLKEIANLIDLFRRESLWAPTRLGTNDPDLLSSRHDLILLIASDLLKTDPVRSYVTLLEAVKREEDNVKKTNNDAFLSTLLYMKHNFEKTQMIKSFVLIFKKLGRVPEGRTIYHTLFDVQIKPAFVSSRVSFKTPKGIELIDQYMVEDAQVSIYKHPEKVQYMYYINPPEYNLTPEKYFLLSKTREVVSAYRPEGLQFMSQEDIRNYFIKIYENTISDIAAENNIQMSGNEKSALARIVTRYTVGYGMMELFLSDRKLTDVYMDAPLGTKPVYVIHSEYGSCQSNVVFTEEEAKGIISRFRAQSGRPFDEAHPVLDFDIPNLQTRVCVIGPPLSPDGRAFALRLHKQTPWTLPQFIDAKMMDATSAGLLSFLVDAQASLLVNGSRGSGKTSLLMALMLELMPSSRIIVQEDTQEIPVPFMKQLGYNIQRLKTQSAIAISRTSAEVPPEEALRTALRLGDSVLIVGEVRSKEAIVLYEAMRVGAVGNVVMGTIHGENAYSVWDRIVNDLGVPNTSFKATDVVVTCAPIRFRGSLRRQRRLIEVTEVGKHWYTDPEREGGLINIIEFDTGKDANYIVESNLAKSELFPRIAKKRGLTVKQLWEDIYARAATKQFLVDMKNKYNIPFLLESKFTVTSNDKWLLILEDQRNELGGVDYEKAKTAWQEWVLEAQVKPLVQRNRKIEEARKAFAERGRENAERMKSQVAAAKAAENKENRQEEPEK
ncbi:MAG: type II/IV secretion system ATPase subunit [Candidatus Micrarchaeota archaeon]